MGKHSGKRQKEKEEERVVTMKALEEMSSDDDDDEMPPEEQRNDEARALKAAIERGAFDHLVMAEKTDTDEESIEEVELDDGSSDGGDSDEGDEPVEKETELAAEESDTDESASSSEDEQQEDKKSKSLKSESSEEEEEEENAGEDHEEKKEMSVEQKNNVNSKALHIVTEGLVSQKRDWPWAETFDVMPTDPLPFGSGQVDVHDDLKREVAFYDVALKAVLEAKDKCEEAGISFSRPDDFFAEMVKTDDHMAKVKDRLIFENKKMEAVAQRKSVKEQKLRAREAHSNRMAEKARRKKDHFKAVQEWAQAAASSRGRMLDDDDDGRFLRSMGGGAGKKGPNKKRQLANKKYGFGGKRGRFKQNTPETMNDMSGFNPQGNFGGMGTKRTAKSKSAGGANRKGKRARDAMRSRR